MVPLVLSLWYMRVIFKQNILCVGFSSNTNKHGCCSHSNIVMLLCGQALPLYGPQMHSLWLLMGLMVLY